MTAPTQLPGTSTPSDDDHPVLLRLTRQGTLSTHVKQAASWALASRVAAQLLQFVGVLVTARLLVPSDYGVYAVVYPIVGFAAIFTNLGLDSAVIHAKRLTEEVLSTAFWVNAVSGVGLTVLFCLLSVPIAELFREPQLVPLICLASLGYTVNCGIVQTALLERTLRFKQIAVIDTAAGVVSFAGIVVAAALGAGAFALVIGPLLGQVVTTLAVWSVVRWFPRSGYDHAVAKQLWSYSKGVTGFQAVSFWARNADNLLLARVVSQADLGNYNRAYNLMRMPVEQTIALMSRVLFPALARLRDDPARMGRAWLKAMQVAVMLTAPATLVVAVSAPATVEVLLGSRWLGMVTVLQLLSVAALPQVISSTSLGLLRATGDTGRLFRLGLFSACTTFLAMGIGLPWGTRGVATALLVKFLCDVPITVVICCRQTGLPQRTVYAALRGIVLACAGLVTVGVALRVSLPDDTWAWLLLLTQGTACLATYVAILFLVDRPALTTTLSVLKRRSL